MKICDAYQALKDVFRANAFYAADLDARLLLAALSGLSPTDVRISTRELSKVQQEQLNEWQRRRLAHEPVGRIIGRRGFWTLELELSKATLEPRPDTETLVELALATLSARRDDMLEILDLGTGSGAIALSLLSEWRQAKAVATDLSFEALRTARGNAINSGLQNRISFACGHWMSALNKKFDLIVSNPPYISSGNCAQLAPEVQLYDPLLALDGGEDGLRDYRLIADTARGYLAQGGFIIVEIGHDQSEAVADIFAFQNFALVNAKKDLGGHVRALCFRP